MGLLLVPAARENLSKSIEAPVNLQFAQLYLPKDLINNIIRKSGQEGIRCWAVSSSRFGIYKRIEEGDIVLFTEKRTGKFTHKAEVVAKTNNVIFGDALWPVRGDNPWKYIYFLKNIQHININKTEFVQSLGFASNYVVPGTIKVDEEKYSRFLKIKDQFVNAVQIQKEKIIKKPIYVTEPLVTYDKYQAPVPDRPLSDEPYTSTSIRKEKQIIINEDQIGISYNNLFGEYLIGATEITLKDPYIRLRYQIKYLMEFAKLITEKKDHSKKVELHLITNAEIDHIKENEQIFKNMAETLNSHGIELSYKFDNNIHDRSISVNNGWKILLGRGIDIFKKTEYFDIAELDQTLRKCKACEITIIYVK